MIEVSTDWQGWPNCALNFREFLKELGIVPKDDNSDIVISKDSPLLDAYPVIFEDDGMAYGINRAVIIATDNELYDSSISGNQVKVFNIFREKNEDIQES